MDPDKWNEARQKADALIKSLSLKEKSQLVTGTLDGTCIEYIAPVSSAGFGGLCLQDGPNGLRTADLASVFPSGVTAAASWDKSLMYARALAMAQEFHDKGANVLLGPVAGPLGRSPWGGRNWEGFSIDPYLTGVAVDLSIRATQSVGVQAAVKHFIGNEQETQRKPTTVKGVQVDAISSNIDDRTLHEVYLWPFADAVHAGVSSVMCSYNRVNGTYACEDGTLLNKLLKKELGFQGYVSSDFFATPSGVKAAKAGLDVNLPGPITPFDLKTSYFGDTLVKAVQNESLPLDRLNDMVRRVLVPYLYFGQDKNYPSVDPSTYYLVAQFLGVPPRDSLDPLGRDVRAGHDRTIRDMAAAGTVLLKNDDGILPLKNASNIAIFGSDAGDPPVLVYPDDGPDFGTLAIGGGAGGGRSTYIISPLEAIRSRASKPDRVQFITDNNIISNGDFSSLYPKPAVCLLFLNSWSVEGADRTTLEADDDANVLVERVSSFCSQRTIVVTHSSGVNLMPWASNPNVSAIVAAHYPGQESGNSIADVLFGDVNPSGKLPYTIPKNVGDINTPIVNLTGSEATGSSAWHCDFEEGLMVDYRHFDAKNITPQYEFGFGLSYTTFSLSNASIRKLPRNATLTPFPPKMEPEAQNLGGNPDLWVPVLSVSIQVSNTGSVDGAAVPQLYVSLPQDSVPSGTPIRVLRGFDKVAVDAGASRTTWFTLTRRDLSFWDVAAQEWRLPSGKIGFHVGLSSRDIQDSVSIDLFAN